MLGQRALREVLGLGAAIVFLAVPAVIKMPVALELRAARPPMQITLDGLPGRLAVVLQVVGGHPVGDAPVAQHHDQPIE